MKEPTHREMAAFCRQVARYIVTPHVKAQWLSQADRLSRATKPTPSPTPSSAGDGEML